MRLLLVVFLAGMAIGLDAYGGYGAKSSAFKTRADFEPKDQTISPTLPPAETPYETPPPIPMPEQTVVVAAVEKSSSSESGESKESKGCGPSDTIITTTTTEHPQIKGCGPEAIGHVHVDSESGAPLEKALPPQVGYGEPEKPAEHEKPAVAVSEYAETSAPSVQPPEISASHFSSATKEEVELYGIETPVHSTPAVPSSQATIPQQEVTPSSATSAIPQTPQATSGYEQPAPPVQLPVESASQAGYEPSIAPSTNAPLEPHSVSFTGSGEIDKSVETSPIPSTTQPQPVAVEANNGYESGPVEVPAASPSPPPPSNVYEPEETPAQEIARVPDNENLYEKIAEVPPTSPSTTQQTSTISTTAATIPYEAPVSSAPYEESPAPRAQVPTSTASSGYDLVNEVEPETKKPVEEPYGQKVEAAHITEETAASSSDYDQTNEQPAPSSQPKSSQQTTSQSSGGYDQENVAPKSNVAPSAIPYNPVQTSGSSYAQSGPSYGQSGAGAYSQGGGGSYSQAGNLGGYSIGQQQSFLPAPTYVQPQSFVPQQQSFGYAQSSSYGQQSGSNGCCGGNWFSRQGSLCAPVNYNPCQSQSSGCGQSCGGCSQQSFGGFGSSCGGGCSQPACQPCTPACTPSCAPVQSSCCCPQPAANPFSSLCGGRKKRSIQTLLGLCGRRHKV